MNHIHTSGDLLDRSVQIHHKDIGQIAANQVIDGLPVINRTKNLISPFADIVKTPSYSENSGTLTGYSIEIEDESAQSGYRHLGNVSDRYLLLTNSEVRELGFEIARASGMPFSEGRAFFDGGKFAYVIDFGEEVAQNTSISSGSGTGPEVYDPVGLSLVLRTSYDQSWKFEAALMGRRFVCDNGLLSGEFFGRVSFRHQKGNKTDNWRDLVRGALSVVNGAQQDLTMFCSGLRKLRRAQTSDRRMREVIGLYPQFGDALVGKIMRRYSDHEEANLFGLMQAGTNVLWHDPKQSASSWAHNDAFVTGLIEYASRNLN